jgi:hypothetical protein
MAGAGAGDQQAVAYARHGIEAAVFGIKIGTYAAAGRGVEHGDVSNVHDQHPSGIVFGSVIRLKQPAMTRLKVDLSEE